MLFRNSKELILLSDTCSNTTIIPKIDSKQIDELNKKAKETQKNIEDLIEKKDGIIGFYNEATAKFNAFVKNIENFFNSFIGNSESKDEKNEENKK